MNTPLLLLTTLFGMFVTAWILVRRSPGIAALTSAPPGTFAMLDGLRGLLACSVLVHHAYIARDTYAGQPWTTPASPLYHFAGDGAVAVFFMITGLLFWDKALSGRLHFPTLMRSRLRRILPLQAFCLALVFLLCAAHGSDAPVAFGESLEGMIRWLGMGLLGEARIHDVPTLRVDAGVSWSLTLEWLFYLSLVPLARLFVPRRRFCALVVALLFLTWVCRRTGHFEAQARLLVLLPFLGGMATAYIVRRPAATTNHRRFRGVAVAPAILSSVAVVPVVYHHGNAQMLNLLLVPAFVGVVLGNDLFTLLRRRCLRWLGHISFSVYLLHGIVLVNTLRLLDRIVPVAGIGDAAYAGLVALIGAAVVAIASLTYWTVERAFFDPLPPPAWWLRLRSLVVAGPNPASASRKPA